MKALAWIGGSLAALIILTLAFSSIQQSGSTSSGPALGNYPALATVEFDDLSQLQVLKLERGQLLDGDPTPPKTGIVSFAAHGSRTTAYTNRFSIRTQQINGQITGREYTNSAAPSGLFLLLEAPFFHHAPKYSFNQGQLDDHSFGQKGARAVEYVESPATEMQSGRPHLPPLCLQLADGQGGWHTAIGPIQENEADDSLAVVTFPVWPTTAKTLDFRALIPGEAPETFSLPNPFPAPKALSMTPSPLPQTHAEKDFTLTLKSAGLTAIPELGEILHLDYHFESHLPKPLHTRFPLRSPVEVTVPSLRTEWGQITEIGNFRMPDDSFEHGHVIASDGSQFEATFRIERSSFFPRKLSDVIILAKAKVAPDGKTISLLSQEKGLGLKSLLPGELSPEGGGQKLPLSAQFEWKSPSQRKAAIGTMSYGSLTFYLFVANATTSSGGTQSNGSGQGSGPFKETLQSSQTWYGALNPGDEFTIAIGEKLPDQEITFTFDRSHLRQGE
ncbi:hypothetical protein [Roseibacillus ishigakijimensis]|uniref:Uncharacterized protein n=1 Tax=Roseibacillus ishigakijimensis TaxID=454146 RepID=A0A934VMF0_9BACT|nr:hypothetical protein [Roseibacillus ishigakijimensis]MBK1834212.1 hypothetical protein [Roseibacillus ishigakijimensis]